MGSTNQFFEFSSAQLKFLTVLAATAFLMAGYLLIRAYANPTADAPSFEVFVGSEDRSFVGTFEIDPNSAPADSLELLPGIGPVLADRIVAFRQHDRFERAVDITEVKGIGPKLFEKLRPYLKVRRR